MGPLAGMPEKGAGGQLILLPFDRRGKRGQSALFIKAICNIPRDSYAILIAVPNS